MGRTAPATRRRRRTRSRPGPPPRTSPRGTSAPGLTDDGGVLPTALVEDPAHPLDGFLWALKPFAKDGSISFTPDAVAVQPLPITNLSCSLTAADRALTVQPASMSPRSVMVSSAPVQVTSAQQTAQ